MNTFKKGDRVVCIHDGGKLQQHETYIVLSQRLNASGSSLTVIEFPDGKTGEYYTYRFAKVKECKSFLPDNI